MITKQITKPAPETNLKTYSADRYLIFDIETAGLDPRTHGIISLGYRLVEVDPNSREIIKQSHTGLLIPKVVVAQTDPEAFPLESKLTKQQVLQRIKGESQYVALEFLELIEESQIDFLVGFNILNFDIPFIVENTELPLRHRWDEVFKRTKVLDLRTFLNPDKYAKGKLHDYLRAYEIENHDEHNGSQVPQLLEKGDYDAIIGHMLHDINSTVELFKRAYLKNDKRPPKFKEV